MNKPALFGGPAASETPLYYGAQVIDDADIKAVTDVLKSPWLTCGPAVPACEEKLKKITGAKYAVLVNSGTSALHIACMAAGIKEGDEVITTPITFAASANCALYCGATPIFADINPETYCIDPASAEACITEKTKAIIPVHFTGQSAEMDKIRALCEKHNLFLIDDAAHAIGTLYNGTPIGSLGDMTCFSFHPVKTVTAGEGGAVTTNDPELYKKLLLARSHGITKSEEMMERPTGEPWYHEQIDLGYNYRMTDINAALLSSQLDKLEAFKARRQALVKRYDEAFAQVPGIIVQKEIPESDTCRHLYIIQIDPDVLSCTRGEFFEALDKENVHCQVHYIPTYRHPYYEHLGYKKGLCPNAETLYERIISIPLHCNLTDEEQECVIEAVSKIAAWYRK